MPRQLPARQIKLSRPNARRFAAHVLVRTVVTASLCAVAVSTGAAQAAPNHQALMVDGAWSGWVDQADVQQTAAKGGAVAAQVTVRTAYLGTPLLQLLSASLAGKARETKLQVATFNGQLAPVSATKLGSAHLQEIDLPAVDAGSSAGVTFTIKFSPGVAEQGLPSGGAPGPNPRLQPMQRNFRLDFDSLAGTYVSGVGALTLIPDDVARGAEFPTLVLSTSSLSTSAAYQKWSRDVQAWFTSGKPRNGTLTFLGPDMRTPLFVEQFRGLRVTSISTGSGKPTIHLSMTGMSIGSTPMQ